LLRIACGCGLDEFKPLSVWSCTEEHEQPRQQLRPGRQPEALTLCEETLKLRKAKLGPDHADTLGSRNNLASRYAVVGRSLHGNELPHDGQTTSRGFADSTISIGLLPCGQLTCMRVPPQAPREFERVRLCGDLSVDSRKFW
jgi:hypothetical protein